jgi:3',5'-cyclic AMP phosphodiesterase CpdA
MKNPIKVAQISDLHFSKISFNFKNIFSKSFLGNINLLFSRKKNFSQKPLKNLSYLLKTLDIQYLVICGDITSTSSIEEFEMASSYIKTLKENGINCIILPGNHDIYTKSAEKQKIFFKYFNNDLESKNKKYNLKDDDLEVFDLNENFSIIAINTALATTLISSRGLFKNELFIKLEKLFQNKEIQSKTILLTSHFPYTNKISIRKNLKNRKLLQNFLKNHQNIKLFLHGHIHEQKIEHDIENMMPICIDSGSCSHTKEGSFNLLELNEKELDVTFFKWNNFDMLWQSHSRNKYFL